MPIGDLLKGGAKSASFPTIGTSFSGTVISAEVKQSSNFDTGELETWDDGRPKNNIVVTIQTDVRDPEVEHDDGVRGVYIKTWGDNFRALKKAVRESGDDDIHEGGTFTATYVSDGPKPKKGYAPKLFSYTYTKPSSTAGLLAEAPAAPAAAAPVAAPSPSEVSDPAYAAFLAYKASQAK